MMNIISQLNIKSKTFKGHHTQILLILFILFIFTSNKAYSAQASFSGDYTVRWIAITNADTLSADMKDDASYADLRFRLKSIFEINENAKGVVALESGHTVFGIDSDSTSAEPIPGDDSINLKLKSAYVDFTLPNAVSNVMVGLQPIYIFDGLLANEDAWGITYFVNADRKFQVNFVRIYENRVNDEYMNDDRNRTSTFYSIFYENDIFTTDIYNLLLGYYDDKNAYIDDTMYNGRHAMYIGLGYKWKKYGIDCSLDILYDKGRKRYIDNVSLDNVSKKSSGYLTDLTLKRDFENFSMDFEFVLATGDNNKEDKKDREFMSIDGLTNFYNRAYILSGYITQDDIDEKEGIFDSSVYKLTNLVFFKLGSEIRLSQDKRLALSVMYAINDKPTETQLGRERTDIGSEVDATYSVDMFDTYYSTGKGLLLNVFGAYFVPGNKYKKADGTDADDVYLVGTGLEYVF